MKYCHVRGHMDDLPRRHQMLLQEDLNVDANKMVDHRLWRAVREDTCLSPDFPYKQIEVIDKKTRQKALGSISEALSK